jgi:hypothetical protein
LLELERQRWPLVAGQRGQAARLGSQVPAGGHVNEGITSQVSLPGRRREVERLAGVHECLRPPAPLPIQPGRPRQRVGQAPGRSFAAGQVNCFVAAWPGTIGTPDIAPGRGEIKLSFGPQGQDRVGLGPGHSPAYELYSLFSVTPLPRQAAMGEIGEEPRGLIGPLGQASHLLGGPARLTIEAGLERRADRAIRPFDCQPRIRICREVRRSLQITVCGCHLASAQADTAFDGEHPGPAKGQPGVGQRVSKVPGPAKVTAGERGFCGFSQPRGPGVCRVGQLSCALPRRRGHEGRALARRQRGGGIERGRGRAVGTGRGSRKVPGGALSILACQPDTVPLRPRPGAQSCPAG